MKCFILLALVTVAASMTTMLPTQHPHHNVHHSNALHQLIHKEVGALVIANPHGFTPADCTAKCDAIFDLSLGHDEKITDAYCVQECTSFLHHHHDHTTTAAPDAMN